MDIKHKFIIAAVIILFFLIGGSIFVSYQSATVNTTENNKETTKENSKIGNSATSDFEKKLVKDNYLLVKSSLTWQKFGEKLNEGDEKFVESFSKLFNDLEWNGVFFECKAFKPFKAVSETVEFRLIKTDAFDRKRPDHSDFDEHFDSKCPIGSDGAISFLNLDKSSTLVSPCPANKLNATHIKSFMKSANLHQRKLLLEKVGEILLEKISAGGKEKIWLSTSGLGVSWLHVRFDPYPKYYETKEYKR